MLPVDLMDDMLDFSKFAYVVLVVEMDNDLVWFLHLHQRSIRGESSPGLARDNLWLCDLLRRGAARLRSNAQAHQHHASKARPSPRYVTVASSDAQRCPSI